MGDDVFVTVPIDGAMPKFLIERGTHLTIEKAPRYSPLN